MHMKVSGNIFQSDSQKERSKGEYEGRSTLVQEKMQYLICFLFRLCAISSRTCRLLPSRTSRTASAQWYHGNERENQTICSESRHSFHSAWNPLPCSFVSFSFNPCCHDDSFVFSFLFVYGFPDSVFLFRFRISFQLCRGCVCRRSVLLRHIPPYQACN